MTDEQKQAMVQLALAGAAVDAFCDRDTIVELHHRVDDLQALVTEKHPLSEAEADALEEEFRRIIPVEALRRFDAAIVEVQKAFDLT